MAIITPTLITFLIYIFLMIMIGLFAYRTTKNLNDYLLGGRRLGSFVTALSAGASDMSGWLLMGLPGAIYVTGLSESWIAIGLVIGAYLNWKIVAGRLRIHTEINQNVLTIPAYFAQRFEDKSGFLRLLSAVIILIFFIVYCASGIVASALLFESIFGIEYRTALWLGATATIIYTAIGGFLAVSWMDTVQASIMIFALILTPVMVVIAVGGFEQALVDITVTNPTSLNMVQEVSMVAIISSLGWGLGYFGQPHILARFMAANSHHVIHNARRISMIWMIFCLAGAVAVGLFGSVYFTANPNQASEVLANHERVFISLAKLLFNPWITGVLLSAILAAIMSTLSCQLLVCSSAVTEDLYKTFFRQHASQEELVWVGRFMVLLIALIAIKLAADPNNKVLGLVSYAWAGFGSAFGPIILLSVIWQGITRNGALVGMLVGATTVIVWKQFEWFSLYEIIPGFLFATVTTILVSKLGKPSETMLDKFYCASKNFI